MQRRTFLTSSLAVGTSLAASHRAFAQSDASSATPTSTGASASRPAVETGYASIGKLKLYYEIHGSGEPLVFLHGGLMTIAMAEPIITALALTRQVVAVELEGHGHTALLDRPLSYEQMADDVAALIEQLDLAPADLFGFSVGGGVAWQIAIRHPELVRKLVVASAPIRVDGWAPVILGAMASLNADAAAAMTQTPLYAAYASVAPRPEDWPALVTKVGQLSSGAQASYDWTEEVAAIEVPILFIVGDADSVTPKHRDEIFELLGGGVVGDMEPLPTAQLAVLPGTAHSALLMRLDLLVPIVNAFLAG